MAREASKERNNAKSESYHITSEKYAVFCAEIRNRKKSGWDRRAWEDDVALEEAIEEYKAFIFDIKLFPTIEGMCSWLDISRDTYYAALSINDNRSYVFKKFKTFLDDFSAQNIISTEGNPAGNMYVDKSRLGFSDQPTEQTLNINFGPATFSNPQDLLSLVENTPIEVDYEEIE